MADETLISITGVKRKLIFLMKDENARAIGQHVGSEPSFAKAIGIKRSTLRGWINDSGTRRNAIPTSVNNSIAARFRFPADWPPWITGGVDEFTQSFANRAQDISANASNAPPASLRDVHAPLGIEGPGEVWEFDPMLAVIRLSFQQSGPGEAWPLNFEISCQEAPVEGITVVVKKCRVHICCGLAHTTSASDREQIIKSISAHITGSNGPISVATGGSEGNPVWLIDGCGKAIGHLSLPADAHLCKVYSVADGDVIDAQLTAYYRDLDILPLSHSPSSNETTPYLASYSFLFKEPTHLSVAKSRLLDHLIKLQLPRGDAGWARLATHKIRFVSRTAVASAAKEGSHDR